MFEKHISGPTPPWPNASATKEKIKPRERPEWDAFYMAQAFIVSRKSMDPNSQHGCVVVSTDNRPLSSACNGPIKGSDDENIPLTRPEKYLHMIHSEENALIFYSGSHSDIQDGTCYVTGRPCHRCLRMWIQKGIKRFVHGGVGWQAMESSAEVEATKLTLSDHPDVTLVKHENPDDIISILRDTISYIGDRY